MIIMYLLVSCETFAVRMNFH